MAQSLAIRLGIDLGNTVIRVAYVYPDGGRAVVALPVSPTQAGGRLPICEHLPINDPYVPPFFPGLSQRIERDFGIRIGHGSRTSAQMVADTIASIVKIAHNYSGATVDGIVLTLPAWQPPEARTLLREAILATMSRAVLAAHSDAAAAYVRAEMMNDRKHETALLLSAGYTGLEVAIIRLTQKGHRVLAESASQGILAGNCFDFAILHSALLQLKTNKILVSGIREATPDSVELWTEILRRVELAKQEVEDAEDATFALPVDLLPGAEWDRLLRISGPRFRKLVGKHMDSAVHMIDMLMQEAGIDANDVDHIILEGGGAHLPGVSTRLGQNFPGAELRYLPSDALASGAALLAMETEFHERFDAPSTDSDRHFVPDIQVVPDLVELVVEPADAQPDPAPSLAPPAPEPQMPPAREIADPPIEDVTLADLRRLSLVDRAHAMRRLHELREAVAAQVEALRRAVVP